ncbi:MAG: hypothetical protein ACOX7B_07985 [Christensenellales bacterium]|jgi:hypothetical protein
MSNTQDDVKELESLKEYAVKVGSPFLARLADIATANDLTTDDIEAALVSAIKGIRK